MSDAGARTKRVTRPRSRRSRAGRRSVGKRECWVEVARVVISDVRRARVDGIFRVFGSGQND